jgi:hypothetical protein
LKLSISFRLLASAWQSSSLEAGLVGLGWTDWSHSIGGRGTAAGLGGELKRAPAKRSAEPSESEAEFTRFRNWTFPFGVPEREENLRLRGVEPNITWPRANESHSEPDPTELIGDDREGELRPLFPFCIPILKIRSLLVIFRRKSKFA